MSKVVSLLEIQNRINIIHNKSIIISEYKNMGGRAKFKCLNCGNIWKAYVSSVSAGKKTGCKICSDNERRNKIEDVSKFLESYGCELISKKYTNARRSIRVRFVCGHIKNISFQKFKDGQRCSCDAVNRQRKIAEEKTKAKILNIFLQKNFTFISCSYFKNKNTIVFECNKGHVCEQLISTLFITKKCKMCTNEKRLDKLRKNGSSNWKGGKTKFRPYIADKLSAWKKSSMNSCHYKCIITGGSFDEIHHLYPVNKIIDDAIEELNLVHKKVKGNYSSIQAMTIIDKVIDLHNKYPLGVCLRKDVHILYHKLYGVDNTPEQFYEFQNKIANGEIIL